MLMLRRARGDARAAHRLGRANVDVAAGGQPEQKRALDRVGACEQVARPAVLRVARRRHGHQLAANDGRVTLGGELVRAAHVQRRVRPADGRTHRGGGGLDGRREEEPRAQDDVHRLGRGRRRADEHVELGGEPAVVGVPPRALLEPKRVDVPAHQPRAAAARVLARHALRWPPVANAHRVRGPRHLPRLVGHEAHRHEVREALDVKQLRGRHALLARPLAAGPALSVQREEADPVGKQQCAAEVEGLAERTRERRHLVIEAHRAVLCVWKPLEVASAAASHARVHAADTIGAGPVARV